MLRKRFRVYNFITLTLELIIFLLKKISIIYFLGVNKNKNNVIYGSISLYIKSINSIFVANRLKN